MDARPNVPSIEGLKRHFEERASENTSFAYGLAALLHSNRSLIAEMAHGRITSIKWHGRGLFFPLKQNVIRHRDEIHVVFDTPEDLLPLLITVPFSGESRKKKKTG
jgi:hypothetical protein